jgi:hypothetical protein
VTTDERGAFDFRGLPAGQFQLYALKPGFVRLGYGQRTSQNNENPSPITLADGQQLESLEIALPRAAVIEGRLLDQYGDPVAGARIESMRRRYTNSSKYVLTDDEGRSTSTDDHGRFRIYNLEAGPHYLSAVVSGVVDTDQRPTLFYPGTFSMADAQPVVLRTGEEVSGIALQIPSVRLVTVAGNVTTSNGRTATITSLTLSNGTTRQALLRPDGSFLIPNVAPGEYQLAVRTDAKEALLTTVAVGTADLALALVTGAGAAVRGRIVFDGERPPNLTPRDVRLSFATTSEVMGTAPRIADDWAFETTDVIGAGMLRASQSGGGPNYAAAARAWMLKGVFRRGVDVTDTPIDFSSGVTDLEVLLTARTSAATGTVTDVRGQIARDATVVVFAADREKWGGNSRFIRTSRSDQSGRFNTLPLPPGRYLAVAVDGFNEGVQQDPALLAQLRSIATALTLAEGETTSVDLKLAR